MAAEKAKDLARRLRALAARLSARARLPVAKAEAAAEILTSLERLLVGKPEQMPLPAPVPDPRRTRAESPGDTGDAAAGPIRIWSDGSCAPNPGAGGWAAILERNGAREELSGAVRHTTNNVMEMTAAIEALRRTPEGAVVELTTDSQYVKNGITLWIEGWKRKGWRKADGGAVRNREHWEALDRLVAVRKVRWNWIRGHSGHPENERCDELANAARRSLAP